MTAGRASVRRGCSPSGVEALPGALAAMSAAAEAPVEPPPASAKVEQPTTSATEDARVDVTTPEPAGERPALSTTPEPGESRSHVVTAVVSGAKGAVGGFSLEVVVHFRKKRRTMQKKQ